MEKQSLYDINEEHLKIINEIEAMDGEITEENEAALAINEANLKQKAFAYNEVITQKEGFNQMIDSEIKRLQAMKKTNQNLVGRLKYNLLVAVKTFGEFQIGTIKFGTRKSTSVEVDTEKVNALPDKYKTRKITEAPDKKAIKSALEDGEEIPGCRLSHNLNLSIK